MGANTPASGAVGQNEQSGVLPSATAPVVGAGHAGHELRARIASPAVCVIEDDLDLLSMMASALREAGYHVIEAKDGAQFLRTFGRAHQDSQYDSQDSLDHLDVLVTDNRMPSISGLSVLEKARERNWVNDAILVSAYVDEDVRAEASRLGASVLAKPFSIETLLAHVGRLAPLSH